MLMIILLYLLANLTLISGFVYLNRKADRELKEALAENEAAYQAYVKEAETRFAEIMAKHDEQLHALSYAREFVDDLALYHKGELDGKLIAPFEVIMYEAYENWEEFFPVWDDYRINKKGVPPTK